MSPIFEDRFENMLKQYDQALSDRRVFIGLVHDLFPEENMQANLMISGYDLGIAADLQNAAGIDRAFAHRYVKRLQNEQGISKENAEWAISTWCVCYGKNILGKACSVSISPVKSEKEENSDTGKEAAKKPFRNHDVYKNWILPIEIGMRADGTILAQDFGKIPHILVCGFSGTGKTNFVQTVLATLAKEHSINEIGYLIYDSKSTDYSQFDHLPHMVGPVFNDQRQFFAALEWLKTIILKRYSLFAAEKVSSLDAYNNRSTDRLPHLFVVIDDLYGLLYNAEKESVDSLKYLLMNGRQAGVHFIIVTSTPSSKVLQTGLLTNLPCRICFAMASKADSRTILVINGAEELAVPGEIYFKIPGHIERLRAVHMPEEDILDAIIALDDGSSATDSSLVAWLTGRKSNPASETKAVDPYPDVNGYAADDQEEEEEKAPDKVEFVYDDSPASEITGGSSADGATGDRPKLVWSKEKKKPFWLRFIWAVLLVFAVFVVIGMIITLTDKSGSARLPVSGGAKVGSGQVAGAAANETGLEQVTGVASNEAGKNTVVIPAHLVYDGSYHAEHVHFAEEYGLSSLKKNKDGSITVASESKIPDANVDALVATLSEECKESGYTRFVSVSVNEDHTLFTIHVNDINIYEKERQAITDMFLMAGLEAVQTGHDVDNIRVEIVNSQGKTISTRETNK